MQSFQKDLVFVALREINEDVDRLEKACITLAENSKRKEERPPKESNGTKEVHVDELEKRIKDLEGLVEDKQQTIDSLQSEIKTLKENKSNGVHQNGTYPFHRSESATLKEWQVEKESLVETNTILETKIKGLMEELQKYQDKAKEIPDSLLQQKEKKDLLTKLDEFDFLFRQYPNAYRSNELQPIDKVSRILEAVKGTMMQYFNFVVLALKYDFILKGNSKYCNLDATELYDQAISANYFHADWPLFILAKLSNKPIPASLSSPPPPSLRRSSSSGRFPPLVKRVSFSPQVITHAPH